MKQLTLWDNCWMWGDPFAEGGAQSDARYFYGNTYALLREVVKNEWVRTYSLWRKDTLDSRTNVDELLEVVYYLKEATDGQYKNVHEYIATRLGTSRQRVARLLKFVSIEIYLEETSLFGHIRQNMASISEAPDIMWKPSEKEIQRKKLSVARICAAGFDGCLGDSKSGKVPLCLPCHTKASQEYGLMLKYPEWLLAEIERIRNEHYKAACDACYEDYHGTMSIDELETYLDAG